MLMMQKLEEKLNQCRIESFIYICIMLICDNVSFASRRGLEKWRGCGAGVGSTCAGAGRERVQLVRGGAGAGTEFKVMCGLSQARGPRGGCGHYPEARTGL